MSTQLETTERPLRSQLRYVDLITAGLEALEKAEARILQELGARHRGREVIYLADYDAEHSLRLLSASAMGEPHALVFPSGATR